MGSDSKSALLTLRQELAPLGNPVIMYNKSHSGSQLLARLVGAGGFFIGANINPTQDSWEILKLVEYLVIRYYPDYSPLWSPDVPEDKELTQLIREVFANHLKGYDPAGGIPWGWKLCETTYIIPVLDFLFPQAKYIHLIRDGRDVAFCDHTNPRNAFWKKVYFNTDTITTWRNRPFTKQTYLANTHLYNAMHWVNSVLVGRCYGAMLHDRCLEVQYEQLCENFPTVAKRVLEFCGTANIQAVIEKIAPKVRTQSVAKHKLESPEKLAEILEIEEPLLRSLGYVIDEIKPGPCLPWHRRLGRLFSK